MDVTLIRLLDGTRLYLHAVIDNYLRKLLAWEMANKLEPANTCRMLKIAGRHFVGSVPTVMADSGVENVNGQVDTLLDTVHSLDSATAVERLVAFYVEQHNTMMSHRAFDGRIPDEGYFGVAANLESELANAKPHKSRWMQLRRLRHGRS